MYASDLRVESRVVVAEKTDPRARAGNRLGETFGEAGNGTLHYFLASAAGENS